MKRLFIAIKPTITENIYKTIQKIKPQLADEKIRWVKSENLHITIKFLGDTEEMNIPLINSIIQKEVENKYNSFKVQLTGIGIFREYSPPRVIWMGIQPPEHLQDLNKHVEKALTSIGFERSMGLFSPHLTLGRMKFIKNTELLQTIVNNYKHIEFNPVLIDEIILFESLLKPEGPEYIELNKFKLKNNF